MSTTAHILLLLPVQIQLQGELRQGLGYHQLKFDSVIGIVKAYTTRVGNGPFPTELLDDDRGEKLREVWS